MIEVHISGHRSGKTEAMRKAKQAHAAGLWLEAKKYGGDYMRYAMALRSSRPSNPRLSAEAKDAIRSAVDAVMKEAGI